MRKGIETYFGFAVFYYYLYGFEVSYKLQCPLITVVSFSKELT